MPKFSLIIPVYNVEAYLRECLDSILRQSMEDWEAIVVDDGSGVIADEYAAKDSRITVIHQENPGVSVARNVGLEKASSTAGMLTASTLEFFEDNWDRFCLYEKRNRCL